jgi:serine beta-lactamase-like protein LACTB, mitochondrial
MLYDVSKHWNRTETWVALFAVGVGVLLAAIGGLHVYVTATATKLHPDARKVPSTTQGTPAAEWGTAVDRARAVVRGGLSEQNLPGLSVAVGVDGRIVWTEGFGWADLEDKTVVSPQTRFRLGTASTVLTSAAVGLLLEHGQLKLEDEIQAHVPEFPRKQWPATMRQLMAHMAGVRTDSGDEGPLFSARCERPVDALPYFADKSLLFEPGTRFRHSSYGWILVSAAVEAAAHESFLTFMRNHIFEPLKMGDTKADSATDPIPNRATPYFPRYGGDPRYGPDVMRPLDYSCYSGAGVFLSTPADMVRFGMAIDAGTLLKPETVHVLQTSQRLPSGEETGYGLGWDLETVALAGQQTRTIGHDGEVLGGMVTSLMTVPERKLVVAVMTNTSYADTASIASKVAQAFIQVAR